jgi:cysteinyl-tRNA synthetase
MKRLNYYQVHKNKKPKKLQKSKPNLFVVKAAVIAMQSFAQHAIIMSKKFNSVLEKSLAVVENVKNHAEAISNLIKNTNARTSNQTKRTPSASRKLLQHSQER